MDYRAIAELVMFVFLGLSVCTVAFGFSVRVFLAPVLRDLVSRMPSSSGPSPESLHAHLTRIEGRLDTMEESLGRLNEAQRFDRQLERGDPG